MKEMNKNTNTRTGEKLLPVVLQAVRGLPERETGAPIVKGTFQTGTRLVSITVQR
jgi:hypothetical protein